MAFGQQYFKRSSR